MRIRNVCIASIAVAAMLAIPASASAAASLNVNKTCYGGGDSIDIEGAGYQPSSPVAFTVDGAPVREMASTDAAGAFGFSFPAPFTVSTTRRTQTLGATSPVNPALTASTPVKLSIVRVKVRPQKGKPDRTRRINATGFTNGTTLYAHKSRGKSRKTIRVGKLQGACRSLSIRRKLFAKNAKVGKYQIQFDAFRRYRKSRTQKVIFELEIFRNAGVGTSRASAASKQGEGAPTTSRWRLVRP